MITFSLQDLQYKTSLNLSNAFPHRLLLDPYKARIFCATKEGTLLFIDISEELPKAQCLMPVAMRPIAQAASNSVKSMELDTERNLLLLVMRNSDILVL